MKMIAVTQRVEVIEKYGERRDALDQSWCELIYRAGYVPLILPNNKMAAEQLLSCVNVSGFILTGGNDLYKYGGNAFERDTLEMSLIGLAIKGRIPVLGVCRGMQLLCDYFGGSLEKVKDHAAVRHTIKTIEGEKEVNSFHNFCVTDLPEELLVTARSKDGVIEELRHKHLPIYGIMHHPEREKQNMDESLQYIKKIFG